MTAATPPPISAAPKSRPSPFNYLARVHALSASANAAIAIALADSLFFDLDPNAARSQIIYYLLLSVAPFVLVAPLIGPAIDKIRSGRKIVLIGLLFAMGLVSLAMIGRTQTLFVFPLAFLILVFGKGYAVAKSSIMPQIALTSDELVPKNSRLAVLAGIMSFAGALPAALLILLGGSSWAIGLAMIQFFLASLIAFRLPARRTSNGLFGFGGSVDFEGQDLLSDWQHMQSAGGQSAPTTAPGTAPTISPSAHPNHPSPPSHPSPPNHPSPPRPLWRRMLAGLLRFWRRTTENPSLKLPTIRHSGLAMLVLRGCVGFMTFFLAFHFRGGTDDIDLSGVGTAVGAGVSNALGFDVNSQGAEPLWKLGVLAGFGVVGGLLGSFLAPRLRRDNKEYQILFGSLLFVLVSSLGAWFLGGLLGGMLIAFAVGFSGGAGRVAFDSIVQRDASQSDYGRSFAIFETRFQFIWVIGALIPVLFKIPFALGCVLLMGVAVFELVIYFFQRRRSPATPPQMPPRMQPQMPAQAHQADRVLAT